MPLTDNSLLLELPLPFKRSPSGYMVEMQALNGLKKWADNFDHITVCAPLLDDDSPDVSSIVWRPLDPDILPESRVTYVPLPVGYRLGAYYRYRKEVREKLEKLIAQHQYLCFSNIGTIGSWGNIAVTLARKQKHPYSIWFDWVIHEMPSAKKAGMLRKAKVKFDRLYSKYTTLSAIKHSQLGLFHGKTVYDAYQPYSLNPHLVHNIHLSKHDAISDNLLRQKCERMRQGDTLKIGYTGRVDEMKAPYDWIEIVGTLVQQLGSHRVEATWFGDGDALEESRLKVEKLGLRENIRFVGFESDRGKILDFLRSLDVFLFCHVTPESPRCLIEALVSGTPIIGYESAYAEDLVGERGGGIFSPIGDKAELVNILAKLADDREWLVKLSLQAASNRPYYNADAVFLHRSELIKQYTS